MCLRVIYVVVYHRYIHIYTSDHCMNKFIDLLELLLHDYYIFIYEINELLLLLLLTSYSTTIIYYNYCYCHHYHHYNHYYYHYYYDTTTLLPNCHYG